MIKSLLSCLMLPASCFGLFVLRPSSFVPRFFCLLSSVVRHLSSFDRLRMSGVALSSLVPRPSSFVPRLSSLVLFLSILLISSPALAAFPKPQGFVNDFAGVIDADTKPRLESLLSSFAKTSGIEIAVVTLPSLDGRAVEDVAVDLYKTWGIGKKGKDNGALFLVAPNERKMRIEAGYGLEGVLNDALAGRIMDENVVPNFKAGNISAGIAAGTAAIIKTIAAKEGIDFDVEAAFGKSLAYDSPPAKKGGPLRTAFKILFFIFMAYLFIRHPWLFLLFLSGGRGGGGGRGFSGGFGGFGGGMSGGGGASRSW